MGCALRFCLEKSGSIKECSKIYVPQNFITGAQRIRKRQRGMLYTSIQNALIHRLDGSFTLKRNMDHPPLFIEGKSYFYL